MSAVMDREPSIFRDAIWSDEMREQGPWCVGWIEPRVVLSRHFTVEEAEAALAAVLLRAIQ